MSRDPFDAASNEAIRSEQDRQRKQRKSYAQEAIDYVMSSEGGREAMAIILDLTRVFLPVFNTNALQMAHNEGRRAVGLEIMSLIDPEHYQLMIKESNERRKHSR